MSTRPRSKVAAAVAIGAAVLVIWAAVDNASDSPMSGETGIGVASAPTPLPDAASVAPPPRTLLTPPTAPSLANTAPATADAFVGRWVGSDATALTIARTATDRYQVRISGSGSDEAYDGILRDGRIHIERGIDGDWVQASADAAPCLYLGTAARFCR